ncbi:MAG: SPASM domain-containing protein, partial [Nitrospirae bacterium]|nr:SPASM domain-containing protein [Nitrospirota bacterium]
RESFIIGDVAKTGLNGLNTKFMTVDLWRDPFCSGCSYRPICGGGCRGSSVTQSNDFHAVACEKPYFENVAIELVKRESLKNVVRSLAGTKHCPQRGLPWQSPLC